MKRLYIYVFLLGISLNALSQEHSKDFYDLFRAFREYKSNNEYRSSISVLNESLNARYGATDYNKALARLNLGILYWDIGSFDSAQYQYKEALKLVDGADLHSIYMMNSIYNNLALVYEQVEDSHGAMNLYDAAERSLLTVNMKDTKYYDRLSAGLLNKAIIYIQWGQYKLAIEQLKQAERIKEKYSLDYLGSVFFNLARSYERMDQKKLADTYYRKSIDRWTNEYGPEYYQLATTYLNYGMFLLKDSLDESSLDYFETALNIYSVNFKNQHPYIAECYFNISEYYLKRHDLMLSLSNIQSALIAICPTFSDSSIFENPIDCNALLDIGLLKNLRQKVNILYTFSSADSISISELFNAFESRNSATKCLSEKKIEILKKALETNNLALEILMDMHKHFPSKKSQLYIIDNHKQLLVKGIEISYQLYHQTNNKLYLEKAFEFASIGKSIELEFEKQEKEKIYLLSLNDSSYIDILKMKDRIAAFENRIQLAELSPNMDTVKISDWEKQLFEIRRQYESSVLAFRRIEEIPSQGDKKESPLDLKNLQRKMKRNETLIEYILSDSDEANRYLYSFIIRKNTCILSKSPLDSLLLQKCNAVSDYFLQNVYLDKPGEQLETQQALSYLYQRLIAPIEAEIKGENLIIIPDEELLWIPFEALINSPENELDKPASPPKYLLSKYSIYSLNNSGEYKKKKRGNIRIPSLTALAPTYSSSGADQPASLPGAITESKTIAKLFDGEFLNGTGKDTLLSLIQNRDILHLAMHAHPGAINTSPYLLLSSNDSTLKNRLYDYEINTLLCDAGLVVLSACETGLGEHYSGEGIQNMSRSFTLAGAEAVIHSMWALDDRSSSDIMIRFYKELKRGKSLAKALRNAKLSYLKQQSPSFQYPVFWAGYQLYGNGSERFIARSIYRLGSLIVFVSISSILYFFYLKRRKKT